eukprot:854227-Prymnesium_polylepis.3
MLAARTRSHSALQSSHKVVMQPSKRTSHSSEGSLTAAAPSAHGRDIEPSLKNDPIALGSGSHGPLTFAEVAIRSTNVHSRCLARGACPIVHSCRSQTLCSLLYSITCRAEATAGWALKTGKRSMTESLTEVSSRLGNENVRMS